MFLERQNQKVLFDMARHHGLVHRMEHTRVNVTDCIVAGSGYETGTYVSAWRLTSQWLVWFRDSYLYGRIPMHDRSVVPVFGPCFVSYHGTVGVSGLETMKGSDFFAWPLDGHGVSDVRWLE